MRIHHDKHHQAYVDNLNKALEGTEWADRQSGESWRSSTRSEDAVCIARGTSARPGAESLPLLPGRSSKPGGSDRRERSGDAIADTLFGDADQLNGDQRRRRQALRLRLDVLVGQQGLILLDPLDSQLKQVAAPLYAEAARRAHEIAIAIVNRSRELEEAGYHAQVAPSENSFPLFWHDDNGARHALTRTDSGKYQAKSAGQKPDREGGLDASQEYSAEELAAWALREPDRFSPNVTLRAVVQDFLLPTVAYYGGAAEIAYFAQTAEVYRILDRPVTPILQRASMTLVERHTWRSLERYGISLTDFFAGLDHVLARVVKEYLGKETAEAFDHTTRTFNSELDDLQEQLRRVDPTLAEALEKGRRKINYQIDGLRTRFNRAQVGRDEAVHRQIERAFDLLYPGKTLQERRINITSLLARHGRYAVDWVYDAIDLGSNDHQIVYL